MHLILATNARISILFVYSRLIIFNQPKLQDLVNAQFYPIPNITIKANHVIFITATIS
jgi:hypothetical protein